VDLQSLGILLFAAVAIILVARRGGG